MLNLLNISQMEKTHPPNQQTVWLYAERVHKLLDELAWGEYVESVFLHSSNFSEL